MAASATFQFRKGLHKPLLATFPDANDPFVSAEFRGVGDNSSLSLFFFSDADITTAIEGLCELRDKYRAMQAEKECQLCGEPLGGESIVHIACANRENAEADYAAERRARV